jgi:hypothetical protein
VLPISIGSQGDRDIHFRLKGLPNTQGLVDFPHRVSTELNVQLSMRFRVFGQYERATGIPVEPVHQHEVGISLPSQFATNVNPMSVVPIRRHAQATGFVDDQDGVIFV